MTWCLTKWHTATATVEATHMRKGDTGHDGGHVCICGATKEDE